MIIKYISELVKKEKQKGFSDLYIKTTVKEYLQVLVLNYIYTSKEYKSKLIFTGGTCLRHFYSLERLSEDLDFDMLEEIDTSELSVKIQEYFTSILQYKDLNISVKQEGRQILLKFPILKELKLANESESDLLYVKIDISETLGKSYKLEKTTKSAFGYNFVAIHYDLPSLFAGKITAILRRNLLKGKENIQTIKGRDFYDLLWYLKRGVKVSPLLVNERLGLKSLDISSLNLEVFEKVELACSKYKNDFESDLLPFISNPVFIKDYVNNYLDEIKRYKIEELVL